MGLNVRAERPRCAGSVGTLDSNHRRYVKRFKLRKKNLPQYKKQLAKLEKELRSLEEKDMEEYITEDIERKSNLRNQITELEDEIYDIENNISEMEYYSNVTDTLTKYYDLINIDELLPETHEDISEKKEQEEVVDRLDKMNQLYKKNRQSKLKKAPKRRKKIMARAGPSIVDCLKMGSMQKAKEVLETQSETPQEEKEREDTRASLYHEFRLLIDPEYATEQSHKPIVHQCDDCGKERVLIPHEGRCVCPDCGECEYILIDLDHPNQKDSLTGKPGYPYKRINHFNEWLAQFQAKENTEIPERVYRLIHRELKKMCFRDFENLSYQRVKKILKRLDMTQYYEHVPYIISKINGLPPPTIGQKMENRLRSMFLEIQEPFQRHCPPDRTNFLSYSYVLHKLCQLLELDDFTKCFQLLKSRDKLRQQDKTWEKICEDLLWEYYPSV